MTHPLATPAAQAKLATYSFDDFVEANFFASTMMPHLDRDMGMIYSMKATIYWLQARGTTIPQAVLDEVAEWDQQ